MGGGGTRYTPKVHPEERMLAEIAKEQWDSYKETYVPLENEWMENVAKMDDPSAHQGARDITAATFQQRLGGAMPGMQQASAAGAGYRRGNNIGAYTQGMDHLAQAKSRASQGVTDRYARGMENILGMGAGQRTEGMQGLTEIAQQSVQGRIDAQSNAFSSSQANSNALGTAVGAASAWGLNSRTKKRGV
jgi:hypothetical protein